MSQSSVARELPENQRVVSASLTQQSESSRGDDREQTERLIDKRSPTLEMEQERGLQSHVKVADTLHLSEEQTAVTKPLEQSWIRKNEDDYDDDGTDGSVLTGLHGTLITGKYDTVSMNHGPLDDSPKNQAFVSSMVEIDPSVKNYLYDIQELYDKISDELMNRHYFRKKVEYNENIKIYSECCKKYFRKHKTDEIQARELVKTARESLGTLRECLLDMTFECFAETEHGEEIAQLDEQARTLYQAATDEVRATIDRRESLYANFLANRNAFLLHWKRPEDDTEQEAYTEQELQALDRMKAGVQKYLALCKQEVKKCYEQALKDEALLNTLIQWLPPQDHQQSAGSFPPDDLQNLKYLIKDIKSLHKNMQEEIAHDPEFQQEYLEKCQEYTRLVDHLKKTAVSKSDHDHNENGTAAQETLPPDTPEQSQHAQDISNVASEVLFQLMDIRDMLLERSFECFAETEQGQDIAQLEEQARELYWAAADQVCEQADQQSSHYADFLAHRNAFLCRWNRSQGESKSATSTERQKSALDKMKKSLHLALEWYQQEMKRSYEHALDDEALLQRLIRTLHTYDHPQVRKALRSNGLPVKKLFEDVSSFNKSMDEEWDDRPDFRHDHSTFQEEYHKNYYECTNSIDQFSKLGTLEEALKVISSMTDMRRLLLVKLSETLFVKDGKEREVVSPRNQESSVPHRQHIRLQAGAENHQDMSLGEHYVALENTFAAIFGNEEGKHIDRYLEEINTYLSYNKYIGQIAEKELNVFKDKKNKIFDDYDAFLGSSESIKKRQMREVRDQLLIAKIKIEERLYVLFLHHSAGKATQQLEEKYSVFAETIDFLFQTTPLDLQNSLRAPSKEYNAAKADLMKLLVDSERSAEHVKSCIERLNHSLAEQITAMKEKIWSQFTTIWYESGVKKEIMDFLLEHDEYQQGELESYIKHILHLSQKIDDRLYQQNVFRQALKIQFAYNIQISINNVYNDADNDDDDDDQRSYSPQSVYEHVILLHNCMVANEFP